MSMKVRTRAADAAFGATVNALLFQQRRSKKDLGDVLDVAGTVAGRKLRGELGWSLQDMLRTAAWLGIPVGELLPTITNNEGTEFKPAMLDSSILAIDRPDDRTTSRAWEVRTPDQRIMSPLL